MPIYAYIPISEVGGMRPPRSPQPGNVVEMSGTFALSWSCRAVFLFNPPGGLRKKVEIRSTVLGFYSLLTIYGQQFWGFKAHMLKTPTTYIVYGTPPLKTPAIHMVRAVSPSESN